MASSAHAQLEQEKRALQEAEQRLLAAEQAEKKRREEKSKEKEEAKTAEAQFVETLEVEEEFDAVYQSLVDFLKNSTGSTGVYLAQLISPDLLKYVNASDDHKFMVGETLARGTGVTFDLFPEEKKKEEGQEEEDDDDEETKAKKKAEAEAKAKADAEGVKDLYVPNVLMGPLCDRIKFFRLPGLGSYYSVACAYKSFLNQEAINKQIDFGR